MAIEYTWTIPTCEHDISTGGISIIHWRCTGVDGDYTATLKATLEEAPEEAEVVN
tara:strand:+ start:2566 stop:2730 length:165 start_codon:yes stop_codon:yes gene_type:complete